MADVLMMQLLISNGKLAKVTVLGQQFPLGSDEIEQSRKMPFAEPALTIDCHELVIMGCVQQATYRGDSFALGML